MLVKKPDNTKEWLLFENSFYRAVYWPSSYTLLPEIVVDLKTKDRLGHAQCKIPGYVVYNDGISDEGIDCMLKECHNNISFMYSTIQDSMM